MKSLHSQPFRYFSLTAVAVGGFSLLTSGITAPAWGAVSCSTTTPMIDQTVTCTGSGSADITVPLGAMVVSVVVKGAGGGAGYGVGGAGGNGASVQAEFSLAGTSTTRVVVGDAGLGGATTNAGLGGGFSAIYLGASSDAANAFIVAGGGGGGQGDGTGKNGGNASAASTAAGGDGAASSGTAGKGADGSGNGGAAGEHCGIGGGAGQTWTAGGAGGAGYSITTGGAGGAGYGGGGGGSQYGSGGAGGSFVDSGTLNGVALFSPTGGTGGTRSGTSGGSGSPGSIVLTFKSSLGAGNSSGGSGLTAAVEVPSRQIVWQGSGTGVPSALVNMNTWMKTPTTAEPKNQGDRLLGWSTDKDFPVEIAARQVNNGWGVFEIFNSDGSLRSLFIPAGNYTFVGNDNTLHAIWSHAELLQRC